MIVFFFDAATIVFVMDKTAVFGRSECARCQKHRTNVILGLPKTAVVCQMNQSLTPLMSTVGDCQFLSMHPQLCLSQPKLLFFAEVSGRREKNQTNVILGQPKTAKVCQMNQSFSPLMHMVGDC